MKTYIKFLEPFEKELTEKIKKMGLTITVSGPASCGKSTGGKAIANALGLKYTTSGEIFRNYAKKRGIPLEKFSAIREKEIDYEIDKRTLELAMSGGVVLDGRLTGWVAGDWADVRVYYDSPLDIRIKRASLRDGIPVRHAAKIIKQRDDEDNKKYKELYGINMFDKSIYNIIVVNDEKLTLEDLKSVTIKLVKQFLEKRK
jgi:cytidylate kinase